MRLALYLFIVNLLTYFFYWYDKRGAIRRSWRVPEFSLLLMGFLGGSPAAFYAQRHLRHKTYKPSFQFQFWALVIVQGALIFFHPGALPQIFHLLFG